MVSINTNITSLVARRSLSQSTNKLNQAIERMSTGYKINHASDNAANYSISTDMSTKIGAYQVAQDNTAMGLDLVTTAQDTISLMQSHGTRIRSLIMQAQNGTYGDDSQSAIVAEINARISEIDRLYNTTEYNGKTIMNNATCEIPDGMPQAGESGFIDETVDRVTYTDAQVAAMTRVANVSSFSSGGTYSITTVEELQKLADYVNNGGATAGRTFVLGADLDLSSVENWTPIGVATSSARRFKGTFDGNGHKIENVTINSPNSNYVGFFGYIQSGIVKNLSLENIKVNGTDMVGGLAGYVNSSGSIINCSVSDAEIIALGNYSGGLIGRIYSSSVSNSYANGNITGHDNYAGGFIGCTQNNSSIVNSYSNCNVCGTSTTGGFVGWGKNSSYTNCYSSGNVSASAAVGGFVGVLYTDSYTNYCYSSGFVTGDEFVGGFVGITGAGIDASGDISISNSASFSNVSATDIYGSFIGMHQKKVAYPENYPTRGGEVYTSNLNLTNCSSIVLAGINAINGCYDRMYAYDGVTKSVEYVLDESYDMSALLSNISGSVINSESTSLQVGINSDASCMITFDTNFRYGISGITGGGSVSSVALNIIDDFMNTLSEKATQLGAVSNRLDSALESISVSTDNLVSSRSTLRDADIAKVSSEYIRQQILQQACATLMSTANQSPSIALQLI